MHADAAPGEAHPSWEWAVVDGGSFAAALLLEDGVGTGRGGVAFGAAGDGGIDGDGAVHDEVSPLGTAIDDDFHFGTYHVLEEGVVDKDWLLFLVRSLADCPQEAGGELGIGLDYFGFHHCFGRRTGSGDGEEGEESEINSLQQSGRNRIKGGYGESDGCIPYISS